MNVVCSLMEGKVMPVHSLMGGVNYWVEAMQIINAFKLGEPEKLLEISYEEFTNRPEEPIQKLLAFIEEDAGPLEIPAHYIHKENNKYKNKLSQAQIAAVRKRCEPYFTQYNYE